jgi:hypothetical protein
MIGNSESGCVGPVLEWLVPDLIFLKFDAVPPARLYEGDP